MRNTFGKEIAKLAILDKRVYVLDGDLANSTKIDKVHKLSPKKFIQAGIAEQNMVSMAAGMATIGLQPWVVTFNSFLTKRALDQIFVSVAQTSLDVKLIGAYSGILNSSTGKTHQSLEDLAIMRAIPNMRIYAPADSYELKEVIRFANDYKGPVFIRLSRESKNLFNKDYKLSSIKRIGNYIKNCDITILSTGTHSYVANKVYNYLKEFYKVNFFHMPLVKPLNKVAIGDIAENSKLIVTIEDHNIYGGFGSAVSEVVSELNPTYVLRLGVNDSFIETGSDNSLLVKYKINPYSIIKKIESFYNNKMKP